MQYIDEFFPSDIIEKAPERQPRCLSASLENRSPIKLDKDKYKCKKFKYMARPDFLKIVDIKGIVHYVNVNYIVQIYSKTYYKTEYTGAYEQITSYLVNVANAGVACYNADNIEVSEDVYNELIKAF